MTTVGNRHSHPRTARSRSVNGVTYTGGSLSGGVGPHRGRTPARQGVAGATADEARLCFGAADRRPRGSRPGEGRRQDRRLRPRRQRASEQSRAVKDAGGVGMIMANGLGSADTIFSDPPLDPGRPVSTPSRAMRSGVRRELRATAKINAFQQRQSGAAHRRALVPWSRCGDGNLLKPDVTAPGTDILAGCPPVPAGRLFDIISGTSMSCPHVAGLAALLKHRHADWTPMMIKSALMTTGYDILGTFSDNATASSEARRAFAQGAGHVRPTPRPTRDSCSRTGLRTGRGTCAASGSRAARTRSTRASSTVRRSRSRAMPGERRSRGQ